MLNDHTIHVVPSLEFLRVRLEELVIPANLPSAKPLHQHPVWCAIHPDKVIGLLLGQFLEFSDAVEVGRIEFDRVGVVLDRELFLSFSRVCLGKAVVRI